MHWNNDWHFGWMGLWWILIVPALIAVAWFALSAARSRRGDGAQQSPEQILKRQYANGEIDSETYEQKLADLRK
jgi:putative membrane protein